MTTQDNGDWRDRAACRDQDVELFFPVSEQGPGARQVAEAKAVCARCPVQSVCLADSVDRGIEFGVFGGMTETERRPLLRERSGRSVEVAAPVRRPVMGPSQQDIAKHATRSKHNRVHRRPIVGVPQ